MTSEVSHYLESVKRDSRLSLDEEAEVFGELQTHIEDRLHELLAAGLSREDATRVCLEQMGPTRSVARQIYEAYSQGDWKQVLLASIPHLLIGLLFVLNWWNHPVWLSMVLLLIFGTALYSWGHGRPSWAFPWLGYALLPVIAAGLLLVYLPHGWSLLALLFFVPLALWWTSRIIIQSTRRDWLFSAVMLLPLPIIVGWFLAVSSGSGNASSSLERLGYFAPSIGLSFMSLALTIAVFVRLRQRRLRIGLLNVSGLLTLSLVVYYTCGRLNTPVFLVLLLGMWAVFIVPLMLERWLRNGGAGRKGFGVFRHLFHQQGG